MSEREEQVLKDGFGRAHSGSSIAIKIFLAQEELEVQAMIETASCPLEEMQEKYRHITIK